MPRHYLDFASSAPLRPEAAAAMRAWLDRPAAGADPGRLHHEGLVVRQAIEDAREQVAGLLNVGTRQVVFTSGGTEAINAAVWGATRQRPGGTILCAGVEHSAVRDASERLAPVDLLDVDRTGRIDPESVTAALQRHGDPANVALVHCQFANHEVGTLQPTDEIVERCRSVGVPVHVDAAAACGQVTLDLAGLGADLVSVSAHKLGGPPGVGALVVRRGQRYESLLVGGQQERARRAGLENVLGIVGFGAAAAALSDGGGPGLVEEAGDARRRIADLVAITANTDGVEVVGDADPDQRLPHLVCLGVAGIEAEPVLLGLDRRGIAAHSGSACSSELLEPSPVLAAMGADPSHSLRLSVGWCSTDDDVHAFATAFPAVVEELRQLQP